MAVKVGNSWVSEAAYAYAQSKVNEKTSDGMLEQLSEKFPDTKFTTNTAPFSSDGLNNLAISPNILKEMENDPDKRLEYEALIYDCNEHMKNMLTTTAGGGKIVSFGFIINKDGTLGAWSISKKENNTSRSRFDLDKNKKETWLDEILEKKKQKRIEEKKQEKKEKQSEMQEKLAEAIKESADKAAAPGTIMDFKV